MPNVCHCLRQCVRIEGDVCSAAGSNHISEDLVEARTGLCALRDDVGAGFRENGKHRPKRKNQCSGWQAGFLCLTLHKTYPLEKQ